MLCLFWKYAQVDLVGEKGRDFVREVPRSDGLRRRDLNEGDLDTGRAWSSVLL